MFPAFFNFPFVFSFPVFSQFIYRRYFWGEKTKRGVSVRQGVGCLFDEIGSIVRKYGKRGSHNVVHCIRLSRVGNP